MHRDWSEIQLSSMGLMQNVGWQWLCVQNKQNGLNKRALKNSARKGSRTWQMTINKHTLSPVSQIEIKPSHSGARDVIENEESLKESRMINCTECGKKVKHSQDKIIPTVEGRQNVSCYSDDRVLILQKNGRLNRGNKMVSERLF